MSKRKRSRDRTPSRRPGLTADSTLSPVPAPPLPVDRRERKTREREEREQIANRRRRRRNVIRAALAAAGLAALVGVVLVMAGFGLPEYGRAATMEGGVGVHVEPGAPLPQRNRPPTSGPHYGGRATYGVFKEPVEPGAWIHALEHGAVVIAFRCDSPDACDSIAGQVEREVYDPARPGRFGERKIVATPYQEMPGPFAVLAWGRILELETLDAVQMTSFYDRYVDRGPENAR